MTATLQDVDLIAAGAREDFYDCLREKLPGHDTSNVDPILEDSFKKVSEQIVRDIVIKKEAEIV